MWTGDKNFYDLLTMALGDKSELQPFIDAGKDKYNKLELFGFPFNPQMQADFTFEQIEREYGVNAMATWVDLDSDGTPITEDGISLQTGKIPRMKKRADFDEQQYRQALIANAVGVDPQYNARVALSTAVKKLIDAHTNSLTYMRHQMVSTGGFALTADNNKGGITGTVYSASIPDDNKVTLTSTAKWFVDDGQGSTSDPVKDLKSLAEKAVGSAYHFEVDSLTFRKALSHTKLLTSIGYALNPGATTAALALQYAQNMPLDTIKSTLERVIGFRIVEIDSISRIDSVNKKTKTVEGLEVRSFDPNSWALVPDGNIGETLSVAPIKMGLPTDRTAYADYYGGRLLMTYDYDLRRKTQFIGTEMTALVVPDKPKYMYILKTA